MRVGDFIQKQSELEDALRLEVEKIASDIRYKVREIVSEAFLAPLEFM